MDRIAADADLQESHEWVRERSNPDKELASWMRKGFVDVEGNVVGFRLTKVPGQDFFVLEKMCRVSCNEDLFHYALTTIPGRLIPLIRKAFDDAQNI